MDMDSSHPNWLVFSLSNTSLFHPSTSTPQDATATSDHHLSLLAGAAPKLEDFLGGPGASSAASHFHMPDHVDMYDDSELKSIAAGFLRGFSSEQTHKQLAVAPPPPPPDAPPKKAADTFGQRTSIFRGVTRHRWTGRYEAHLWDNSCRREGQSRKGRQVYLGGYDKEEKAARAYDLAALKYWGPTTTTNFPVADYEREMEEMKHMTRQEFVASLRRKSSGFSRGASIYRGVTRHHQHGRWQARIGRVAGNKDLYLGTFSTQEEAAEAYDIAAIKFRGLNAVTNFDMSRYDVKSIANSNLPVGGAISKSKTTSESVSENKSVDGIQSEDSNKDLSSATSAPFSSHNSTATINFALPMKQDQSSGLWAALGYQSPAMATTHPKNPSVQTLQSTTPFSMEYHATETSIDNNDGFFNGCGYYPESSGTTSSSGSVATTMVSNNGATHDAVGFTNNGGWIQSIHAFQASAKTNLSLSLSHTTELELSSAQFPKESQTLIIFSRSPTIMDMDSSHPNWLVFSLSNTSLFHPSTSTPQDATATSDHHLSLLAGAAPKLEDFLGGPGASSAASHFHMPDHVDMYDDSELKSIAAGFLRGFSSEQTHKQLAVAPPPPPPDAPPKKAADTFGQRTSIFRGVTRHRWTGRYEAHLWDNSCRREGQSRKGRQVYLGGYDKEEKAARAYDLAALKYWGPTTTTNFPVADYEREMEEMKHMTRQEFVASLRRKSSGFSRGASIYRGVTRHHQHGRWQARIGRVAGNKDLYLGTFSTQEEAAEAYDIAAIKFRGLNAVTNFDMSRYDVKSIANSNLPVGGAISKSKTTSESVSENKSVDGIQSEDSNKDLSSATSAPFSSHNSTATINFALPMKQDQSSGLWAALGYQSPAMATTHPKNPSVQTLQSTTPFSMEYHATETSIDNNDGFFNGCGYYPESSGTTSSSGSVATTMVSNNGATHDAVGFTNNGGWIQSIHAFQASAKTNLSAFQTPIFGME